MSIRRTKFFKKNNKLKRPNIEIKKSYVFILISSLVSLSMAMYQSAIINSSAIETASWSFKVLIDDKEMINDENDQEFNINLSDTIDIQESSKIKEGTIAPGSQGHFKLSIDSRGSEVGVEYTINIDNQQGKEELPENIGFYTNNNYTPESKIDLGQEYKYFLNLDETQEIVNHEIYWKWEIIDTHENNIKDTIASNKDYIADIKVLGVQNIKANNVAATEEKYFEIDSSGYIYLNEENKEEFKTTITDLVLPSQIGKIKVNGIQDFAFAELKNLEIITLNEQLDIIGNSAFRNCTGIKEIRFQESVRKIDKFAFYGLANLEKAILVQGLEEIDAWAFKDCVKLSKLTIPSTVNKIGESAFSGCLSLTKINIPELVTSIDKWTFLNCTSLKTITIPSGVVIIKEGAFAHNQNLTNINIGSSVSLIEDSAFYGCILLQTVVIPNSVTEVQDHAFASCTSLATVTKPSNCIISETAFSDTIYGELLK